MANAHFDHLDGSVTFTRTPARPEQSITVIQPTRAAGGGKRFGFAQTRVDQVIRVVFRITTAQKVDLVNFFYNVAKGMAERFTFTDAQAVTRTVRFNTTKLSIQEKAFDTHIASIDLRVVSAPWAWESGAGILWDSGQSLGGH